MNLMTEDLLKKIKKWIKENKEYKCYQLKEWRGIKGIRAQALKRDHNECVDCAKKGKHSKAEEVHHIVELKKNPRKFLELKNVVCLCKNCHNRRHHRELKGKKKKNKFENEERW